MTSIALDKTKSAALHFISEFKMCIFILRDNPPDDRKKPAVDWKLYQIMRPSAKQIKSWFEKNPSYNIGAAMGHVAQMVAFDIDGQTAWAWTESRLPLMSEELKKAFASTFGTLTGSGSRNFVFRIEGDISDLSQLTLWTDGKPHSEIKLQGNGHYVVVGPSIHPNGNLYRWNEKAPFTITRAQLDELIRLLRPSSAWSSSSQLQQSRSSASQQQERGEERVLTRDNMDALVKYIMPVYQDGTRDYFLVYLTGAMRKAGFSHRATTMLVNEISERSPHPNENTLKNLLVVDRTYRLRLEEIRGKAGLKDILIDSYQAKDENEHLARVQAFSEICQIINGPPAAGTTSSSNDNNNNNYYAGKWLSEIKATYEDPKDCPSTALLAQEILKLERFRTLEDTKEILWYHKGVFRYGGEQRILSRLDELGGYGVNINIRREVTEFIKIKNFTPREEFDKDPFMVNVKNGVVDLRTGERYAHDPEKYPSLIQIPHNYYTPAEMRERLAQRPLLDGRRMIARKIVGEYLCNVLEPQDIILSIEFWGYDLIGDNRFQKALMNTGPPDAGKSTHVDITEAFLGEENCANKTLKELTINRFAKAGLYGKLANTCADISNSKLEDIETFKMIVSGDDISAENKGKDAFNFKPKCKLHFSANTPPLPKNETDEAYYKRWVLQLFAMKKTQFLDKTKDVVINRKLFQEIVEDENELDDLLHLAVQAAGKLLRQSGFSGGANTNDIDRIMEEYMRKARPITAWIDDNCVLGNEYEGDKQELFKDFKEYCKRNRLPSINSFVSFSHEVVDTSHVSDVKRGKRKEQKHVWVGIQLISKLRPEEQTEILGEDSYE